LTYAIFLVVWGVLYKAIGVETAKGVIIASLVSVLAIPLEVRAGFGIMGARVRRSEAH
jgi:hypothetical protein